MSRTQAPARRERQFPFGWAFVAAILLGFLGMLWVRSQVSPRLTPLEALIAANEPLESVQALAARAEGTLLVATNRGLIQGKDSKWERLPAFEGMKVTAVAQDGQGGILAAGPDSGLVRYSDGQLRTLTPGGVRTFALHPADPAHILVLTIDGKLLQTRGQHFDQVADFGSGHVLSLAISPGQPETIWAGDLQGNLHMSGDGGRTWGVTLPESGSITALQYDSNGHLWMLAGGKAFYSSNGAVDFKPAAVTGKGRPLVGFAVAPSTQNRAWAVSADGLLLPLSQ